MSEHDNAVLPARAAANPYSGEIAIEVRDLVKTYPGRRGAAPVRALDQLSIRVAAGTIFGLLGPNGAGKSTTVKILTTLSRPDSGDVRVAGIDAIGHPDWVRREIGLVSQKASSDPMATGRENLLLAARIQGLSRRAAATRAGDLLDRFGLTKAAHRLVRTYSGGMARRLDVAIGLVHRPQVLFLDEPTTGLDPEARAEMWAEIERLADERTTVLLTTHYLDEADRLADRLAIVDHGRAVIEGTAEDLKRELNGDAVIVELGSAVQMAAAIARLRVVPGLRELSSDGASLRARADHGSTAVPAVLASLDEAGVTVASVTISRPSLDDVYLRYAGRSYHATEENSR
jgi:ABC-2 type transport system ATP-binding protein